MNKIAVLVASLLMVCLGVFLVGGAMSRLDYFALAFIGMLLSHEV